VTEPQRTAEMNATGFDETNSVGNQSFEQLEVNDTQLKSPNEYDTAFAVHHAVSYVVYALGIPGNVLSAIVWLRLRFAGENPSAVYLAALAIDDLLWLLSDVVYPYIDNCYDHVDWLCQFVLFLIFAGEAYDPLLVLGFSVTRLIAISRPFRVCNGYDAEFALQPCCSRVKPRPHQQQCLLSKQQATLSKLRSTLSKQHSTLSKESFNL